MLHYPVELLIETYKRRETLHCTKVQSTLPKDLLFWEKDHKFLLWHLKHELLFPHWSNKTEGFFSLFNTNIVLAIVFTFVNRVNFSLKNKKLNIKFEASDHLFFFFYETLEFSHASLREAPRYGYNHNIYLYYIFIRAHTNFSLF